MKPFLLSLVAFAIFLPVLTLSAMEEDSDACAEGTIYDADTEECVSDE